MNEERSTISARLRGSLSDGWSGDAVAADGDIAIEAADELDRLTALLASAERERDEWKATAEAKIDAVMSKEIATLTTELSEAHRSLTDEYKIGTHAASGDLLTLDDRIAAFGAKLYLDYKTELSEARAKLASCEFSLDNPASATSVLDDVRRKALEDHVRDIKLAAGRHRLAIHALGKIKDGKTLFEHSPTKDQECYEAWLELNDSGAALDKLITFSTAAILEGAAPRALAKLPGKNGDER